MAGTLRAEATLALANLVYIVLLGVGGVVFPLTKFPAAARPFLTLLPTGARHRAAGRPCGRRRAPGPRPDRARGLGRRGDRLGRAHVPLGVSTPHRSGGGPGGPGGPGGTGQGRPVQPLARPRWSPPGSCVQLGAGLAIRLFHEVPPAAVTGLRLWSAAIVLLIIGGRGAKAAVTGLVARRAWRDAAVSVAFGVCLGAMNFVFYQAIARLPLGVAVTIEFLGPLAVAVAGSRRALDLLWVALAGDGVVLLTGGGRRT